MGHSNVFNERDSSVGYSADIYGRLDLTDTVDSDSTTGDFFSDPNAVENRASDLPNRPLRAKGSLGAFLRDLSPERKVDLVGIPVSLAGLILIIINFQEIIKSLFLLLYPVIEVGLVVLLLAVVGIGLYFILRRRRRYYWF